jgi:hypothetical protein
MRMQTGAWLAVLALGLAVGLVAAADDKKADVTGTWKWTFTTQNAQTINAAVKLKQDGDKLTGAFIGRDGNETPIEDAKVKDGEVSFKVTRERNNQKFTVKYHGKVTGDTIKGKSEVDFDGQTRTRDWEAKREK